MWTNRGAEGFGWNVRSLPGVVARLSGCFFERAHVEAGDVGFGPAGRSEKSVQLAKMWGVSYDCSSLCIKSLLRGR